MSVGSGFNPRDFSGKGFLLKQQSVSKLARQVISVVAHCLFPPGRVDESCLLDQ